MILISGCVVIYFGIQKRDIALIVSGIGLFGSFVGMYASAQTSKKQYEQDRPYIIMKTNQSRYGHFQLEFKNLGNNIAIIKGLELNEECASLKGESIPELIRDVVLEGKGSIVYPYTISGGEDSKQKLRNFSGYVYYEDIDGKTFKNKVILNLEKYLPTLTYNEESLKRDYEIIQISKTLKSINENLKDKYITKR